MVMLMRPNVKGKIEEWVRVGVASREANSGAEDKIGS